MRWRVTGTYLQNDSTLIVRPRGRIPRLADVNRAEPVGYAEEHELNEQEPAQEILLGALPDLLVLISSMLSSNLRISMSKRMLLCSNRTKDRRMKCFNITRKIYI
jgi:hypothetical protein